MLKVPVKKTNVSKTKPVAKPAHVGKTVVTIQDVDVKEPLLKTDNPKQTKTVSWQEIKCKMNAAVSTIQLPAFMRR